MLASSSNLSWRSFLLSRTIFGGSVLFLVHTTIVTLILREHHCLFYKFHNRRIRKTEIPQHNKNTHTRAFRPLCKTVSNMLTEKHFTAASRLYIVRNVRGLCATVLVLELNHMRCLGAHTQKRVGFSGDTIPHAHTRQANCTRRRLRK